MSELKNCKNVGEYSGPCKYSGWYCDQFTYCDKYMVKVPFSPHLKGGMGKSKSLFPEQCKYHTAIYKSAQLELAL